MAGFRSSPILCLIALLWLAPVAVAQTAPNAHSQLSLETADRRLPAAYCAKMAIFFLDPADPRVKPAFARFLDNVLAENGVTPENHHLVPYKEK